MKHNETATVSIFLGLPGQEKKEYELKCTHKVLKRFSSLRKVSLNDIDKELTCYDGIACLMYCMLSRADFSLTVDQIDDMLDDVPVPQVIEICAAALSAAFASPGEEESNDPQTAAATGSNT